MPATKARAKKPAPKAKPAKQEPAKKANRKPEPAPDPMAERSAAISAAMKELADVRQEARAKRGGTPAKWVIFDLWLKDIKNFNLSAVAKKFQEVKETTIKSWVNRWHNKKFPANAQGREKEIKVAFKKAGLTY